MFAYVCIFTALVLLVCIFNLYIFIHKSQKCFSDAIHPLSTTHIEAWNASSLLKVLRTTRMRKVALPTTMELYIN